MLSVPEVAKRLGVSVGRVRHLIHAGRIRAQKIGPVWVISEDDLGKFWASWNRKPGRRRKDGAVD